MGLEPVATEGEWRRFAAPEGGSGALLDVAERPQAPRGEWGTGAVHHVAWRVADSAEEMELREALVPSGHRPTPQIDRFWFKSVYFREPGGVLYELATEGPGFAVDEDPEPARRVADPAAVARAAAQGDRSTVAAAHHAHRRRRALACCRRRERRVTSRGWPARAGSSR